MGQAPCGTVGFLQSSFPLPGWFRNACIWSQRAEVWAWPTQHNLPPTGKITSSPSSDRSYWPQPCLELRTVSNMPSQFMNSSKILMTFHPADHLNSAALWETLMKTACLGWPAPCRVLGQAICTRSSLTPQSHPMQLYYFILLLGVRKLAGGSYLTSLGLQTLWLAELGLHPKSCLTPEPMPYRHTLLPLRTPGFWKTMISPRLQNETLHNLMLISGYGF